MKHTTEAIIDWHVISDHPLSETLRELEYLIWDVLKGTSLVILGCHLCPTWECHPTGFHLSRIHGYVCKRDWRLDFSDYNNSPYLISQDFCYNWREDMGYIIMRPTDVEDVDFMDWYFDEYFHAFIPMDNKTQQEGIEFLKMIITHTTKAYYASKESGT